MERGGRVRCIRFFDRTGGGGGEEVNTGRKSGDFWDGIWHAVYRAFWVVFCCSFLLAGLIGDGLFVSVFFPETV